MTHGNENINNVYGTAKQCHTDLLVDQKELDSLRKQYSSWRVRVDSGMSDEQTRLFYKNLIILTSVHKVDRNSFRFVFCRRDSRTEIIREQLQRMGFSEFETDEAPEIFFADPGKEYSTVKKNLVADLVFFKSFFVAGLGYNVKQHSEEQHSYGKGTPVEIKAEPDNPYDGNAVAVTVFCPDGTNLKLGYVPAVENAEISALLNAGWKGILYAEISEAEKKNGVPVRIKIDVFVKRKAPEA